MMDSVFWALLVIGTAFLLLIPEYRPAVVVAYVAPWYFVYGKKQ